MRERLTDDDPETRERAARELYEQAATDPDGVREYLPLLTELADTDDSRYATATIRRMAEAGDLDPEPDAARLAAGAGDRSSSVIGRLFEDTPPSDEERRRAAIRLVYIAAERPADATNVAPDIVAGLAHEGVRADAMRALFHATRRGHPDVDAAAVAEHVDADDPAVRGDAVAVLGAVVGLRDADSPHADAVVDALADPDTAVRQTALGVFDGLSSDELAEAPLDRLHGLVEAVVPLCEDGDPTVCSRAESLTEKLSTAVMARVVEHALGIDDQWTAGSVDPDRAADALVDAATGDPAFARWAANNVDYRASSGTGVDERRAEALLERVADSSDEFDSVAGLREAASGSVSPSERTVRLLATEMADD